MKSVHPLAVVQPADIGTHQQFANIHTSQGCPGTKEAKLDCNSVSAIANVRQADAADRFNYLAVGEIGVGIFTALVAALAARWAKHAAEAGIKSYKAFVAAEDAHLVLDFRQGPYMETSIDGVTSAHYVFDVVVTNVGRSAARLQQVMIETVEGSAARSFGHTLKVDESMCLDEKIWIDPAKGDATISITFATALHPITTYEAIVGVDVKVRGRKAEAYIARSKIGRPRQG